MMTSLPAALAMHRFGLGGHATDIADATRDAIGWLSRQLEGYQYRSESLPTAQQHFVRKMEFRRLPRRAKEAARDAIKRQSHRDNAALLTARIRRCRLGQEPLVERLVAFWVNHFAVSAANGLRSAAAAMEFEAIRPHVLGNFGELLLAVESHPAMLTYLDNTRSAGRRSAAAERSRMALDINENLAREILELHTLGVDGGYRQRDIIELAKALTGWRIAGLDSAGPGLFEFDVDYHEPGERTVLGQRYPDGGRDQADAILLDLALHPATATFIATKLCRHFLGEARPEDVQDLAREFSDSDGDLKSVSNALINLDGVLTARQIAIKTPQHFVLSALRTLFAMTLTTTEIRVALTDMAQPFDLPPSPAGWPEERAALAGGAAFKERIRFADSLTEAYAEASPDEVFESLFGPLASARSLEAIRQAESGHQAATLLLMSPEFQRR